MRESVSAACGFTLDSLWIQAEKALSLTYNASLLVILNKAYLPPPGHNLYGHAITPTHSFSRCWACSVYFDNKLYFQIFYSFHKKFSYLHT